NSALWKEGLKKIINKIAADVGTFAATGGRGQKPLVLANPEEYLKGVADGVVGDYINNIAKGILGGTCAHNPGQTCKINKDCPEYFEKLGTVEDIIKEEKINFADPELRITEIDGIDYVFKGFKDKCVIKGFDLCETDLRLKASLMGGVKGVFEEGYVSDCPLSKMEDHYKELRNRQGIDDWTDFQKYYNPEANEIGAHLSMVTQIYDQQQKKVEEEKLKIAEGTMSLLSTISKDIKTPAPRINKVIDSTAEKSITAEEKQTGDPWADAFGIFKNAFASKLLHQIFVTGFIPKKEPPPPSSSSSSTNIKAVEKIYSSIFTTPIISGGNYDILTNYLSCPENLNFSQVDNCVLNQEMGSLLQNNERLSFQDVIDKNKENGSYNWINLPIGKDKSRAILSKGRHNEGFSLDNIKKMRKARIMPLGLELAAQKIINSSDIDSLTLREIVEKFNDNSGICSNDQTKICTNNLNCPEGVCIIQPFYHLVDPNWILKIPQHECGAKVFGPIL
ncbi:MAG: hypothetical protein C0412_12905, partial [Flavobacterium sp.]|nr:hypothetical protein [Flavobacterium sp.]